MDPVHFTGKEIIEMAIRIEENGLRFYSDASGASNNERLKELFDFLAKEEKRHIQSFLRLKELIQDDKAELFYDPYLEEARMYLRAMADEEVFTRGSEGKNLAAQAGDEKDIIDYAIGMEKDSLLFYYGIEKAIRDKDRPVIEGLIKQERDHLKRLTDMKRELFGRGG